MTTSSRCQMSFRLDASSEPAGIVRAEFQSPLADCLTGNDDATFQKHLFDDAQAQRKSAIQPNCMGDDLGRRTVLFVTDGWRIDAAASGSTIAEQN
jgi:hypothetical protein